VTAVKVASFRQQQQNKCLIDTNYISIPHNSVELK